VSGSAARLSVSCLALALAGCQPRADDVTPTDAGAGDAPSSDSGGDGASEAGPPCVLGGTMTGAPATVACGGNATGRVVLADDDITWTVQQPGGVVMKAPLVGGAPMALVTAKVGAVGLVVVGAYAYFTLPGANEVLRVPLAGGQTELVTRALAFPLFVASDGAALFVTSGQNYSGVVTKLALDPRAVNARPPLTLMDGLSSPRGIAVQGGFVYWTDTLDGALVRTADRPDDAARDGGTRAAVRLAAGISGPSDLALAGGYAYVADQRGSLVRIPLAGGDPELFTDARGTPYGVATDGLSLYWTTRGDPSGVFKIPLAGGTPMPLVTGEADAHFLAVGATAVVWGAWGNGGAIRRVAK
jgi:LVIVD repeat